MIQYLEWDSNLFKYKVGKLHINSENISNIKKILKEAYDQKYKLLYIFTDRDPLIDNVLIKNKALLVDEKTTFLKQLDSINSKFEENLNIISFINKNTSKDVLKLAYQAGFSSRFLIDKNFKNNEFEKLYKIWIEKSLAGDISFEVLTTMDGDRHTGLLTLGDKSGRADIGILAVDNEYRKKGLGRGLIQKSFKISSERGYKQIQVVTQLSNQVACQFYKSQGFEIESIVNIYHLWLP